MNRVRWTLLLVTALGLVLRIAGLGQDFWVDELITLNDVNTRSLGDLLTSYTRANEHFMNSALVWVSVYLFGESEWTVRLPAMLFGAATIPAMYWLARLARFGRGPALAGALLMALSYHHIWFSQNARGYTGYLFFSLLAICALVRILESADRRWTVLFVAASGLNFLALIPSVFVFGAQMLGAGLVLWAAQRRGQPEPGRHRRVAVALGVGILIAALVFLPMAREMVQTLYSTAPGQVTAYRLFSLRFLHELAGGVLPGVGPAGLAIAVVPGVVAAWGLLLLARRAPLISGVLLGSQLLFAGTTLVLGWPIYPRMFILGLPLVILALLIVVEHASDLLPRHWSRARSAAGPVLASLAVLGFCLMLPRLYRLPKQPFRAALVEAIRVGGPDGYLVSIGNANRGIGYYAAQRAELSGRVGRVRTPAELDAVVREHPRRRIVLLSTLNQALRQNAPELWQAMQQGWERSSTLEGTLRGGGLTVWVPKASATR